MSSKATAITILRVAMKYGVRSKTVTTPTIPKARAAAPKPKHGCCGAETDTTPNEASKPIDHGHHEHGTPAKVAESSRCGGTSKESGRPT